MKNVNVDRKTIVLSLAMMLLIYGVQSVSYGHVTPTVVAGEDDTKHKHDGFFLRLTTGIGGATSIEDTEVAELSFSGISSHATIGIGYAVVENLIINLDIFTSLARDSTVEFDEDIGQAATELTISNIGVGATYYIMPTNVYLAGSIALASGTLRSDWRTTELDVGYGINVAVGKEWWTSDNWGIGVAGQLFHTVLPDENLITGEVFDRKTTSIGIVFSATFN